MRKLAVFLQEASCSNTLVLARYHGEKTALEGELSTESEKLVQKEWESTPDSGVKRVSEEHSVAQ